MANNCLVTKLKGFVNNNNLPILDEIRMFNVVSTATPKCGENVFVLSLYRISSSKPVTIKSVDGTNCIKTGNFNAADDIPSDGYVNQIVITNPGEYKICFNNTSCEISITPRGLIDRFGDISSAYNKNYGFKDFSNFDYAGIAMYIRSIKGYGIYNPKVANSNTLYVTAPQDKQINAGINLEALRANSYGEFVIRGLALTYGDLGVFLNKILAGGFSLPTFTNLGSTNVSGSLENIINILKQYHVYSYTCGFPYNITKEGVKGLVDGTRSLVSSDNGITYAVKQGSTVLFTYNTETGTWS